MFTHSEFGHAFFLIYCFCTFQDKCFTLFLAKKKLIYVYAMSGIAGGALLLILSFNFPSAFAGSIYLGASASVMEL